MGRKKVIETCACKWAMLALVLWLGQLCLFAEGFILHLKNGDRLSGEITAETTNQVTLTNLFLGTMHVPANEILKREPLPKVAAPATAPSGIITNAPALMVTPSSTNTAPQVNIGASTNAPTAGGTNTVASTSTNKNEVASAAKTKEEEKKKKKEEEKKKPVAPANLEAQAIAATPKYWQHQVQFGLNMRFATKDQQELLVLEKSTYAKPPFRHIFDLNFTYGKTEGVRSANKLALSEKTEFQLSKKAYIFGLAGGGYDEIRKVDAQFEIDPGFGFEIYNSTNHAFVWKTEGGFNFQKEYRSDDTHLTTYSLRLAEIFAMRVYDKLTTDLKLEFFPNMEDFGEYRVRLENNWRYPLTDRLSLDLVIIDLYDTLAPPDVENNDLQIRSTLGIKF